MACPFVFIQLVFNTLETKTKKIDFFCVDKEKCCTFAASIVTGLVA